LELTNTYRLDVPVTQAWAVLSDLPRAAACLPGAVLTEAGREHGRGSLRVQVGAATVMCDGAARIAVPPPTKGDGAVHEAIITAGTAQDGAAVTVTATLRPWGPGSELSLVTGLTPPDSLAQAGPGIIAAAGSRLLSQFAQNLEAAAEEATPEKATPEEIAAPAEPVPGQPSARIPAAGVVAAAAGSAVIALALVVRRLAAAHNAATKQQRRQIL
jgi:carbon monoxide dehydrogenase subunit G